MAFEKEIVYQFSKKENRVDVIVQTYVASKIPSTDILSKSIYFTTYVSVNNSKPVEARLSKQDNNFYIISNADLIKTEINGKQQSFTGVSISDREYVNIKFAIQDYKKRRTKEHKQAYKELRASYISGKTEIPITYMLSPDWSPFSAGVTYGSEKFEEESRKHFVYVCDEEVATELLVKCKLATRCISDDTKCVIKKELKGKVSQDLLNMHIDNISEKNDVPFDTHEVKITTTTDEGGETIIYTHIFTTTDGQSYVFEESGLFDCGRAIVQKSGVPNHQASLLKEWIYKHGCVSDSLRI